MKKVRISMSWVNDQINKAELSEPVKTAVRELIHTSELMELDEDDVRVAADAFATLVRGHSIYIEPEETEVWTQATPGATHVGDRVRVKSDAYTSSSSGAQMYQHNGKAGKIVAIRRGDIIVKYDGENTVATVRHPITALEKRVK